LRSGQIGKGLAVPRSSDRCDHAIADYFNQQAMVHSQAGRNDLAGAELEAEARALPSQAAELYVQAASALSSGGNWKRVLADAQLALAAHPDHPRAIFLAGLATFRLGDKEQGRAQLLRARGLGDSALRSEVDAALRVLR
jgi:tetratricopeptide (TPR) repeat protein